MPVRTNTIVATGLDKYIAFMERTDERIARISHEELEKAAEPVRDEARTLFAKYGQGQGVGRDAARSAAGYAIQSDRRGTVEVFQSLRPTTGLHPEWGALQMREAFLPALDRKNEAVLERVDHAIGTSIVERL